MHIFLVTLQVPPFQKIIVAKISHGGPIDYIQFEKNRLKFSFLLYKVMYFFQKKMPVTHLLSIKSKNKKLCWFVGILDTFWSKKIIIGLYGHFRPARGHNAIFSIFSLTLQSSRYRYKWAFWGLFLILTL